MREPRVAVIAYPHLYTTLIARVLRAHARYVVETPDVLADEWGAEGGYDAVVASLPVPLDCAPVVIQLPDDFAHPVSVAIGDLRLEADVDQHHPLEGVLRMLDLALMSRRDDAASPGRSGGGRRAGSPPSPHT